MSRTLSILGIAITFVYLGILWFIFDGRLTEILMMPPNEIGDLLAGMFGPLAILWLILGFFQQGIELRQNTQALELQAEELRSSVEQQRDMVDISRKQFESSLKKELEEKEKSKLALQPAFMFHTHDIYASEEDIFVTMTIENTGAPVTNVQFRWGKHLTVLSDARDITTFENSRRENFSWNCKKNFHPENLWLEINFSDHSGEHNRQVFEFFLNGSNNIYSGIMVSQRP